jgi:hypothetical protein
MAYIGLAAALLLVANCNGDGDGGPTASTPGVPVLSNLNAVFGGPCIPPGTQVIGTVNYTDSDGNLQGGTLQTTGMLLPSGRSSDLNFGLPSATATISGTTSGTIRAVGCVTFGTDTQFTLSVAVVDSAGNSSNILSVTLNRPAGAPQVPRGSRGSGWGPAN